MSLERAPISAAVRFGAMSMGAGFVVLELQTPPARRVGTHGPCKGSSAMESLFARSASPVSFGALKFRRAFAE